MKDPLNPFFNHTDFDLEEPRIGHLERFENRLQTHTKKQTKNTSFTWMSIAASVLLIVGFYAGYNHSDTNARLADVSPKMETAEGFFIDTINLELKAIENLRNPNTESIIEDALNQLELLEDTYKELVKALTTSNDDRRVVHAMINNYQNRIAVLQDVLKLIEHMKDLKQNQDEEIYI